MAIPEHIVTSDAAQTTPTRHPPEGVGFDWLLSLAYMLAIFTFFTQFANPIANSHADQHTIAVAILAALTGFLLDLMNKGLKPVAEGKAALRLFAFTVPVVSNGVYFLGLFAIKGIAWSVHLWVGSIVMVGIVGLLLSYVLVPPQEPTEQKVP